MPANAALVEEAPSHRPAMQKFMPMRGQDSFYTMSSGGLGYSLPAAVGMALGRPGVRTVCLIGDGSAMYSIQALWTAARRNLPLTVDRHQQRRLRRDALVQPGDAGAQRARASNCPASISSSSPKAWAAMPCG